MLHGSKHASLTMDARGPKAAQVLRKTVVAKMSDLSVGGFRELLSNGVGGLLLLVPPGLSGKQIHGIPSYFSSQAKNTK